MGEVNGMAQETVADLAKEFRMGVDETLEMLVNLGVDVEEADSPVEEADAEVFRELVAEERRQQVEQQRRQKRRKEGDYLTGQVRQDERTDEEVEEAKRQADTSAIEIDDEVTLRKLATVLGVDPGELMVRMQASGKQATINTKFTAEEAIAIAQEWYQLRLRRRVPEVDEAAPAAKKQRMGVGEVRPPVVTVMGHVDHGKTTLLDTLRHARVVEGEAGGITQHIGAYQITYNDEKITFIDTPGHEAFTAMRARGAQVTDIVILVVSADDGVMPQTIEAINHAKAAEVPIIVAINKCDLPEADPDRVKQGLLEQNLIPEEYGGDIVCIECSAVTGDGLDELLEAIVLSAEIEELAGNSRLVPQGTVIEAKVDKGRGPVATVLVRDGTLKKGDSLVIGTCYGRVRAMSDHEGNNVTSAGPSTPVEVLGLNDVPQAGESIEVAKNERRARRIAEENTEERRDDALKGVQAQTNLEDLFAQVQAGEREHLNIVVKADVQGSVEAICHKLGELHNDDVSVEVKHAAVGPIGKSDVDLAKTMEAIVLGFNVGCEPQVRTMAVDEGVEIRLYAVIYHLLEDIRAALEGLLEPDYIQESLGTAQLLEIFNISRIGQIAGCRVTKGVMRAGASMRVIREQQVVFDGRLDSLKRHQESVQEVSEGLECGIFLRGFKGYAVGDTIECYVVNEVARSLEL